MHFNEQVCLLNLCKYLSFLVRLSQSVVLWQGRGVYRRFGKRPSPYYGKNSLNKQRETTVYHYFKTWRSVNTENFKNFESFFKCSRKSHQALWWNWLSWGPPQERKTQSYLCCRGCSLELPASEMAAQINASPSSSNRYISTRDAPIWHFGPIQISDIFLAPILFLRPFKHSSTVI